MSLKVCCDICGRTIPPHAHYIVRIDVLADPSLPKVSGEDVEMLDFDKTMKQLLEQMEGYSSEELEDQVFKRFEFRICPPCQIQFIANPLGKPRHSATPNN